MDTIFIDFGNSKTSDSYNLLINVSDKTNLKMSAKYSALPNVSIYLTWQNIKKLLQKQ